MALACFAVSVTCMFNGFCIDYPLILYSFSIGLILIFHCFGIDCQWSWCCLSPDLVRLSMDLALIFDGFSSELTWTLYGCSKGWLLL